MLLLLFYFVVGLDPAEPLFSDTDPIVRLDRNDANFVDVIHTDSLPFTSGGLGMKMAIGHIDFYPNVNILTYKYPHKV